MLPLDNELDKAINEAVINEVVADQCLFSSDSELDMVIKDAVNNSTSVNKSTSDGIENIAGDWLSK